MSEGAEEQEPVAEPAATEPVAETPVDVSETGTAQAVEPAPWNKRKWAAWATGMVLIGVMVGAAGVGYLKFVDAPSEGKVMGDSIETMRAKTSSKPAPPNTLSGLTMEMSYPALFDSVGQVRTDPQALEQYNIGSKSDYRRMMAVNVRPLPSGNLEDDSSYRFRQMNTAGYKLTKEKVGSATVAVASKLDHMEQTLFWTDKGRVLSVSITSSNPKDDLVAMMAVVKSGLRWRR